MGLPVHERAPGPVSHSHHGPRPEGFGLGLLRLAEPTSFGSGDRRRRSDASYPHDPRWIAWNLWRAACSRPKLKADGLSVGRKRIARLMRAAGIAGVSRRRSAPITTRQATAATLRGRRGLWVCRPRILRRLVTWGPLAAAVTEAVEQAIDRAEAVLLDGLESSDVMVRLKAASALLTLSPAGGAVALGGALPLAAKPGPRRT